MLVRSIYSLLILVWLVQGAIPNRVKEVPNKISAILVLDISGSMKDSDPGDLRFTGARMFLSLLDDGDAAGVILFSTNAIALTDGLVVLDGLVAKQNLLETVEPMSPDGFTDVKAALLSASEMLSSTPVDRAQAIIVLLTDGQPEIPAPYTAYEQETLDLARSLHVPVLAIALTPSAQTPFLDRLVTQTGGTVVPAQDASDLLDAYLEVFSRVKDRTIIGQGAVQSPGEALLEIEPALAPYLEKASFVLSKPESVTAQLLGPDGQPVRPDTPGVSFAQMNDPRFMVVTIEKPPAGVWRFQLSGNGTVQARAILHSRLRAQISLPGPVHPAGQPLPILLSLVEEEENGQTRKIIGEASFAATITRPDGSQESLDRFYDDGTHGDLVPGDGDYTRNYVNTGLHGTYAISVRGWKGSVPVEGTAQISILPFPRIVVDEPKGEYEVRGERIPLRAHLEGGDPPFWDSGGMIARITTPSGEVKEFALKQAGSEFTGTFLPPEEGLYRVEFLPRDAVYMGVPYQDSLQTHFTIRIIPTLTIGTPKVRVSAGCFGGVSAYLVTLPLTSTDEESIQFRSENQGWKLNPSSTTLEPGEQSIKLEIVPVENQPWGRDEKLVLTVAGRHELEIRPTARVPVALSAPPLWRRCQAPIRWAGLVVFLLVTGLVIGRQVRQIKLPPLVSGTLRYWPVGADPVTGKEADLTGFRKPSIAIGAGKPCDLVIPDAGLIERHATMRCEKGPDGLRVLLEPLGETRLGYSLVHTPVPLHHGDIFSAGDRTFQYLSDSGE